MSTPQDFATAAQALVTAFLATVATPADGIRLLSSLADFDPATPTAGSDPIGQAIAKMNGVCANLFRCSTVIALAQAAATYQPSSATDAIATMNAVADLLDVEIDRAGDRFDDATFNTLQQLRSAVIQDLSARGATLAPVITFKTNTPLPAVVLAERFYNDTTRTDELIAQAQPIHPLFMPTQFQALAR